MTIHSFEGIMVLVMIYALAIVIFVLYALWRKADGKLKAYHRSEESEESESKGRKSNPMADATPIMCGHIESVPKANVVRMSKNIPPNIAMAIFFRVASIVRKAYQRQNGKSINKEQNLLVQYLSDTSSFLLLSW